MEISQEGLRKVAVKIAAAERWLRDGHDNDRRVYAEILGMRDTLYLLGIPFHYETDGDDHVAFWIAGERFEI